MSMAKNRDKHKKPVIGALVALQEETPVEGSGPSWWRALCFCRQALTN